MLYSITPELQKKDFSNRYMGVGIHENCELTNIEYKKTDKGSELIAFYFENELKEQLCHTEWQVTPMKNANAMTQKDTEIYLRLVNAQIKRINAIATTYITQEEFRKVEGNTFETFCKNAIAAIGNAYKGVKVRIKVVYDRRNYTALPSYTNYDWIEPMSIPKEESKIKILVKDKMSKTVPKKLEGANDKTNAIEIEASSIKNPEVEMEALTTMPKSEPKSEDDLPF